MNLLRRLLLDMNPIIQPQLPLRLPILIQRHDQTPRTQPRRPRRVPRPLHGNNIPSPDVNRLVLQRRPQRLVLARAHHLLAQRVPVVPALALRDAGEDAAHARRERFEHGRHEQRGAGHELRLDAGERCVVGEFPRERAQDGFAGGVRAVEERVGVGEQAVADVHDAARGLGRRGPAVGFLRDGVAVVVVSLLGGGQLGVALVRSGWLLT